VEPETQKEAGRIDTKTTNRHKQSWPQSGFNGAGKEVEPETQKEAWRIDTKTTNRHKQKGLKLEGLRVRRPS